MVCLLQMDIIFLQVTHGFRKIWEILEKNTDCVVFYTDFQFQ